MWKQDYYTFFIHAKTKLAEYYFPYSMNFRVICGTTENTAKAADSNVPGLTLITNSTYVSRYTYIPSSE